MLDVADAPRVEEAISSMATMHSGTMWHSWVNDRLQHLGIPYMSEVRLDPWLPAGWSGTADWIFWSPEHKAFQLADLKTTKGEGIYWINKQGAKEEHQWQLSAYWHALRRMGLPLVKKIHVLYLPITAGRPGDAPAEPLLVDFDPIPWPKVKKVMESRWGATTDYLEEVQERQSRVKEITDWADIFVTPKLAPVQERVQKLKRNSRAGGWDLLLAPHWSTAYCRYPNELCDCRTQTTNKVGWFDPFGDFHPLEGHENVKPTITPELG